MPLWIYYECPECGLQKRHSPNKKKAVYCDRCDVKRGETVEMERQEP